MQINLEKQRNPGYTLLELSIVLFIMLMIFSFALPSFNLTFESRLLSETKKIAKTLKALRQQAILQGETYLVIFDTAKSSYTFKVYDPTQKSGFKDHPAFPKPIKLEAPVEFSSIKQQHNVDESRQFEFDEFEFEKIIGQEFKFKIDSSGFMDMFLIHLRDRNNKLTLSVQNIMGDIEIGKEEKR